MVVEGGKKNELADSMILAMETKKKS
jgi:hypothetical protein